MSRAITAARLAEIRARAETADGRPWTTGTTMRGNVEWDAVYSDADPSRS